MFDLPVGTRKPLTRQQLQAVINEKLGNALYWLSKAYRSRPRDVESEKTLLEIMASLQEMQRRVNRSLTDEDSRSGRWPVENEVEA